mgnify:CR=1 FL=1
MTAREQAKAHWGYIEGLLLATGFSGDIQMLEYIYCSSFVHGFRHGVEDSGREHKEIG